MFGKKITKIKESHLPWLHKVNESSNEKMLLWERLQLASPVRERQRYYKTTKVLQNNKGTTKQVKRFIFCVVPQWKREE